jgi:hypothetical protein
MCQEHCWLEAVPPHLVIFCCLTIKEYEMKLKLSTMLVLGALALPAQAETFTFGNLLAGSFTPVGDFATLDVTTSDNLTYDFTLTSLDLDALFTSGAFIGSMAINTDPNLTVATLPSVGSVSGGGVDVVDVSAAGGPGGVWDGHYVYGLGANDRLNANETVSWESTFDVPTTFVGDKFALRVQGLTDEQGGSAWYTPVPEPETYSMMLAGLGIMGLIARRRARKQ